MTRGIDFLLLLEEHSSFVSMRMIMALVARNIATVLVA